MSSLAWSGCSSPEQSGSQGSALGQDDAKPSIVISQVYGAGGNKGASLTNDFVELFNNGSTAVTMTGWALQYASSGGTWSTSNPPTPLKTATIQPGEYYLVQLAAGSTPSGALPTPDDTGSLALSGTSGTVVLTTDTTPLTCETNACTAVASVVDVVGYGAATVVSGAGPTGPTGGLAATQGVIRKGDGTDDGCTNAGNNAADFDTLTETTTTPRNSSTAKHVCAGGTTGATAAAGMVISQVYGGGGNANATYLNDYVELFNPTSAPISLAGASLQYASSTGDVGSPADGGSYQQLFSLPSVTVPAGGYYLVQAESGGANGVALPTPDTGLWNTNFSASNGKIGLVGSTTPVNCGNATDGPCPLTDFIDLVGYGTANQAEGAPVAALSATTAAIRNNHGCVNTESNVADFTVATPTPRNSASAVNKCTGGGTMDAGTDSGIDSGTDSGTGTDAGTDAGTDSGTGPVDSGTKDSGGGTEDAGDSGGGGGGGGGSTGLVISQVYGGGGNSGAPYDADFVEIFNRGTSDASLNGLSLQYGSATGDFATSFDGSTPNLVALPGVTIPAGGYYLVVMSVGGDAGVAVPGADFTGTANLSGTSGKIALVNSAVSIDCGASGMSCPTTDFVDLIGYGTANLYEGAGAAPVLTNTTAGIRGDEGCTDTNDNATDIMAGPPAPRNSATAKHTCAGGGGGGGGGGGTADSGGGSGGGGGGGGSTADSGSSSGDDDTGDDDDDDGNGSTGGKGVSMVVSDPNSGGCSTSGNGNEGALGFGAFAIAALAFANRRKRNG